MSMAVTRKLVEGVDPIDGGKTFFIVEGNPEQGYDLFRCHLAHITHHKRSWQAIATAHGETPA